MKAVREVGPAPSGGERDAAVRRVLRWVLVANLAVILAKVLIGLRSGSIAILGDAAHSGVDAVNNVVALVVMRMAAVPPDEEHPYGHGKFETLGALAVASFLSVSCFELLKGAVERLVSGGPPPTVEPLTFWVLGATMVVNVAVAWTEARRGRELGSELIRADARHTAADVGITATVLGGMALVGLGWGAADAWLAILVALVVAWSGYEIIRSTVPVLVDRRALEADRIRGLAEAMPGVLTAAEIRSRGRPGEAFAELTIRVDPGKDVEAAHRIADRVEKRLEEEVGFSGVVVHVEPQPRPPTGPAPPAGEPGAAGAPPSGGEGAPPAGGGAQPEADPFPPDAAGSGRSGPSSGASAE